MDEYIDREKLLQDIEQSVVFRARTGTMSDEMRAARKIVDKIRMAPSLITLTPPNEWVSVEERLPEDDAPAGRKQITVLVCSKAKKVLVASRIYEPEREYNGKVYPARWRWSKLMNNYVTHWMPLPAPPAKEGD